MRFYQENRASQFHVFDLPSIGHNNKSLLQVHRGQEQKNYYYKLALGQEIFD